jgi:hypothetical protein
MTSYPRRQVGDGGRDAVVVVWWSQVPGPVRAMPVIVRDILIQDRPQVPRPGDQHPVSDYSPRCPHPAFGVRRDSVTGSYVRVTGSADLLAAARELSVKTLIFDVEPLVAPWHSSQDSLDRGIARILGDVRTVPSVRMVVFATNSARRPSAVPSGNGIEVRYLASAEKPLRIAPYQGLPRPGAVAGDQLPTDGVLAYRLRFTFLHYTPKLSGVPLGPALMHRWGELVRPLLFRRSATDR